MNKVFISLILLFSFAVSRSQNTDFIKLHSADVNDFIKSNLYKYPSFTKAKIQLRNGDMASARINFNNFRQVLKYIDGTGTVVDLTNPQDVSFIATDTDTIFCDKEYLHWVASSPVARLAVSRTYKVVSQALIGAFGTASPAKNIIPVVRVENEASFYNLGLNEELTIGKVSTYYISDLKSNKPRFILLNKNNLIKLFPDKDIENYLKNNKVNLNKEQDLVDLMVYLAR